MYQMLKTEAAENISAAIREELGILLSDDNLTSVLDLIELLANGCDVESILDDINTATKIEYINLDDEIAR